LINASVYGIHVFEKKLMVIYNIQNQESKNGGFHMDFETMYFTVLQIDGDYAYLQKDSAENDEPTMVARALLPENIREGSRLRYEMLQYQIIS
jgi:hypothetical protein